MKHLFPLFTSFRPDRSLAALALCLLATAGAAQAQAPTFAPAVGYASGGSLPRGVALGDVNADGRLDVVATNINSNSVGVLLGQAGGSFGAPTTYSTGANSGPFQVVLGDVNADGQVDIVTANGNSNSVGVLLGQAGGTFTAPVTYSSGGTAPRGVALGDVDGDGRLDIVVANYFSNTVGVLLGQAGGAFAAATTYEFGPNGNPINVALGDVNGDGRLDIVATNYVANSVGVLLGQAGGAFAAPVSYATGATFGPGGQGGPAGVALGDVNGDGRLDIVTANYNSDTIEVLLGQAGGTFAAAATYDYNSGGTGLADVALGDVNGDGRLDIVATNMNAYTAGVLLGQAGGTFGTVNTFAGGAPEVALGDVNSDGRLDIVTGGVGVLLNTTVAAPTLSSLSLGSGPVGARVTLTGTNLTGATGVHFSGTATTTFAVLNATTVTATVPAGATTGDVVVTTPGGTSNGVPFAVVSDLTVSNGTPTAPTLIPAGSYNSITVATGANAVLGGDVRVALSFTVQPGGGLSDGCRVINGPGSFTLGAGSILGICHPAGITSSGAAGAVQVTGARSFSTDASYGYIASAQVTGSGLPGTVANLAINTAGDVTLSAPVAVSQAVGVGGAGNLVLGGNALTLLSSNRGTALAVNSSTGVVVGTATVQRFIAPTNMGFGYRHYSAPVSGSTVADLATAGFVPEISKASEYNSSATPNAVMPFPNVFAYDQARVALNNTFAPFDRGFVAPTSPADALVVGQGYVVNIAGTQLVDFTGTLTTGARTLALARNATGSANESEAGWHLVGNPYPAPLDYSLVAPANTGLENAMYVYESAGQYTGSYRPFVNGLPTANRFVGTAQGFFVRVMAGQVSGTLNFRNNQRVTSFAAQVPFRRNGLDTRPLVQLELRGATGATDAFYAYTQAGATAAFDAVFDARKLPNTTGLNLASVAATGERLSIDGRPAFAAGTTLALSVGVPAADTYTLAAVDLATLPAGLDAFLTDAATGQTINLRTQPTHTFAVTAAQAATLLTDRFALSFGAASPLATATALTAAGVTVYPNPTHGAFTVIVPAVAGAATVQAELRNVLGQIVRRHAAALPAAGARFTVETTGLAAGVYTLRLQTGQATLAKRVVLH